MNPFAVPDATKREAAIEGRCLLVKRTNVAATAIGAKNAREDLSICMMLLLCDRHFRESTLP